MPNEVEYIFVYGTLRRGSWNNRLLHDAEFLGAARTCADFGLFVDGLPYVVHEPAVCPIAGEVYALPGAALPRIDALEGHPDLYTRERVAYELEQGGGGEAWLYFYSRAEGTLVPSGDYFDWTRAQKPEPGDPAKADTCYFAYGADMQEAQMRARCHDAAAVGAACLTNHRPRVSSHGLLDITPCAAEEVYGVVWRIGPAMAGVLDRFQQADLGDYVRQEREVVLLTGERRPVIVYSAKGHVPGNTLKPTFRQKVITAAHAAGLPSYYIAVLESLV